MQFPQHDISVARVRRPASRMTGLALVGLLHIALVYAILVGLIPRIAPVFDPVIDVVPVRVHTPTVMPAPPAGGRLAFVGPQTPAPTAPDFDISDGRTQSSGDMSGTFAPDTAPRAIVATHTSPPYPSLARRLGQEGKVQLHLTIGIDGRVNAAAIAHSSGSDVLDRAAVAWVLSHWRYQPAQHAGASVISTAEAVVEFDLRNG